tara:strand:- start:2900 stop:3253 length:354 start_codon:yes stop_codon:yes gene_type:complete
MDFSFEDTLYSSEKQLMSNDNFYKKHIQLKIEYITLLKILEETIDIFKSINSENIILKDFNYQKNLIYINDYELNIKKLKSYLNYIHEIIYILTIKKDRNYKYISRIDKMVNYLIFG